MTMLRSAALLIPLLLAMMPVAGDQKFDQAFQEGKQAAGSINKPKPSADQSTVPGFQSSNPQESQLYSSPSQIESAASAAAETNPAAQSVRDQYNNRPKFNLDPNTDPLINRSMSITDNPEGIVGMMQDGYSDCSTTTTGTGGTTTQSVCSSFNNITTHTCDEILNVTCPQSSSQCPMTGVNFAESHSDITASYSSSSFELRIRNNIQWNGSESKGAIFDREVNFNIADKDDITTFRLIYARFDDWIRIRINGTVVYVGPYGGDRLELTGGGPFGMNRVFYTSDDWGFPEQDKWTTDDLSKDLRSRLKDGNNEIHIRTIVGGSGGMETKFQIRKRCPCTLNEQWDDSACKEYKQ